jgi:tetratricopeptide (TPR) repeat protein
MPQLRITLRDLVGYPAGSTELQGPALEKWVREQFSFLPQPLEVRVEEGEAILTYPGEPESSRAEAARLAQKASKRAAEGNYDKAIGIFQRVLELQPSLHSARRDLAMVYVEKGDVDNATDHLVEVLRVDPKDAWSWVVLANLYIREKRDPETGERFLRRALELKPDDAWALNSLAAVAREQGRSDEAAQLFDRAIAANPEFANPYYGKAMLLQRGGRTDDALKALDQLFGRAKSQDTRSQPVYENARKLFVELQVGLAEKQHSEAFKAVQNYKAELETLSGYPIRIEETDFDDRVGARIQMAWKHGRDYHLISTRRGYAPELLAHLEAHELTHLKMESEARKVGKNLFFATTAATRETALRAIAGDMRKWKKEGYADDSIAQVATSMIGGICGFLFNCPLDMLIERDLRERFPALRPAQFLSMRQMAGEAWATNSNPDIRRLTPRKIMQASLALNGAYALFLDDLFAGASAFAAPYSGLDTFALSQRLFRHWHDRSENLGGGGAEYRLVDEFADLTGLRDWYEWKPDPGRHEVTAAPRREGTTNPELLQEKHPAAVWHLLGALQRYDQLPVDKVREIAFEIGILGQRGLDYADPEPKYTLKSIPGETFTGLQLMCLMFAGFKRIVPDHDVGMDLEKEFLAALEMHGRKEGKP